MLSLTCIKRVTSAWALAPNAAWQLLAGSITHGGCAVRECCLCAISALPAGGQHPGAPYGRANVAAVMVHGAVTRKRKAKAKGYVLGVDICNRGCISGGVGLWRQSAASRRTRLPQQRGSGICKR